jgi:hypothetical protein
MLQLVAEAPEPHCLMLLSGTPERRDTRHREVPRENREVARDDRAFLRHLCTITGLRY